MPKLIFSRSDGTWDEPEWKRARQLYEDLWPEEPIRCPWDKGSEKGEGRHDMANEEILSKETDGDGAPPAVRIPDDTTEIDKIWKRRRLDISSSQLDPLNSFLTGVSFSHIRQWLSQCEENATHKECKASPIPWQNFPGVRFRAIDVFRCCIVDVPNECSFMALSYVWGGVDQPKLTADMLPLLVREDGLRVIWPQIPMTIRDAITVCQRIGERYLWIDSLCIMQDSVRDMKIQILRMRQIYAAAKCTIVAVSADTAEGGLLESNLTRGLQLCDSVTCLNGLLELSPWNSRAWCYQEKVLSHRAILFTSSGIYMQCQNGTYNVNGILLAMDTDKRSQSKFNSIGAMLSVPYGEDLEAYVSAVEYYSQRKCKFQEDKLNAFQGIMRMFRGMLDGKKNSFYYGLPISAFDQTFCWQSRRHSPHLRDKKFPSWSWLGWNESVSFDRNMIQTARTCQMIYPNDDFYGNYAHEHRLRQPALGSMRYGVNTKFGFPASTFSGFYIIPERSIDGSIAHLSVAADHVKSDGSNGLYAVSPTKCSAQPPSPPLIEQKLEEYDLEEHKHHVACEAKTLLGYIWLDKEWRETQLDQCIMDFMGGGGGGGALAGKNDMNKEGQWIITMLMCLQRVGKKIYFAEMERVQIMHCEIMEERWLKTGAEVISVKLI